EPDDVGALVNGSLSVMRQLKMLSGSPTPVEHPVWIGKISSLTSDRPGIFYPTVKRGTYVQQGMKIGYLTDYFGNQVAEYRAPSPGVVLYICAVPSMKKDDTVANIGEIIPEP